MLVIREEQMKVLSRYMVDQFQNDAGKYLRRKFPEKTAGMPEGELRGLIQTGIENAQKYGIAVEADVVRYLECMMTYGIAFDSDAATPWAGKILNDPGLLGRAKAKRLLEHLEKDSEGRK
jgi:hypothetical protein